MWLYESSECPLHAVEGGDTDWRQKNQRHNGFTCNNLVFIPRFRWMNLLKYKHLATESDLCQTHADVFSNHLQDPSWEMIGKCFPNSWGVEMKKKQFETTRKHSWSEYYLSPRNLPSHPPHLSHLSVKPPPTTPKCFSEPWRFLPRLGYVVNNHG